MKKVLLLILLVCLSVLASASASTRSEADPWERYNRAIYRFNDTLDRSMLKPITLGYRKVAPEFVESGVINFFANLYDLGHSVNNLLQGKPVSAGSDLLRFGINSTLGVAGLVDVASPMGLVKHNEDFGQTLAVWGVPPGPYVMLPFYGPSTIRDTFARGPDYYLYNPWTFELNWRPDLAVTAFSVIDLRSQLLAVEDLVGGNLYDPYATYRDAWLERREFLIADRKVKRDEDADQQMIEELEMLDELDDM